jgi:hypothetical protein
MSRTRSRLLGGVILAALGVSGCGSGPAEHPNSAAVRIEPTAGHEPPKVVLSSQAVARLGIRTARVRSVMRRGGKPLVVVPYAAVLYDIDGHPSVYVNTLPRVYRRRPIRIDHSTGASAFLTRGPAAGTAVVTVGAVELLGSETGVQDHL